MTPTEQAYITAIKAMNEAVYAALKAARDTTELPLVNRQMLREIARLTDLIVDAGIDTAKGDTP
jgi:hypothetical protein